MTKRIVMVQGLQESSIENEWWVKSESPVIPSPSEVVKNATCGDISAMLNSALDLRRMAVYYQALAEGWERRFAELCDDDKVLTSILTMEVDNE